MLRELDTQNSMGSEMVSSQTCPLQPEDAELIEELKNAYRCKWLLCAVVGPGFPRRGGANPKDGAPTSIILVIFSRKLHEN